MPYAFTEQGVAMLSSVLNSERAIQTFASAVDQAYTANTHESYDWKEAKSMTRMSASKARDEFSDALNRVAYKGERIVLRRRGKDVAVLVPVEDLKLLEEIEDRIDIEAAKKALKEKGGIPWTKLKKELGL